MARSCGRDLPRMGGGGIDVHHRADDLAVAGAATQHAAEGILDFLFVGVGVRFEQRGGRDQKARRADAALRGAMAQEGGLQRREGTVRHSFDGADRFPPRLLRQRERGRRRRLRRSISTVQAPQSPASQPILVPGRAQFGRATEPTGGSPARSRS